MDFLLLLSAIFSALTGVVTGTRVPPPVAQQIAQIAVVRQAAVAAPRMATAPGQLFDLSAARLWAAQVVRFTLSDIPAYASRRRE